jgi:hypothetical protein
VDWRELYSIGLARRDAPSLIMSAGRRAIAESNIARLKSWLFENHASSIVAMCMQLDEQSIPVPDDLVDRVLQCPIGGATGPR